ncbi:hypothetical protein [Leptothrix sp. BB-3]
MPCSSASADDADAAAQPIGTVQLTDDRLVRLQLEAFIGMRGDLARQSDAIVLSSSKVRLACEALQGVAATLKARPDAEDVRAQFAAAMNALTQRLDLVTCRLDGLQKGQGLLVDSAETGTQALVDISRQTQLISDHHGTALRELMATRSSIVDLAAQSREQSSQLHLELRGGVHRELTAVLGAVAETSRELAEQTGQLARIDAHAVETHRSLQGLDGLLRELADRVQPQLLELVARLDAGQQGEQIAVRHEIAQLHRKLDDLLDDLLGDPAAEAPRSPG